MNFSPFDTSTDGWMRIDSKSGEIYVNSNRAIDCDIPVRYSLHYEVLISDGELSDEGNVSR